MSDGRFPESEIDPQLRSLCANWTAKIERAKSHKRKVFGEAADECLQFYNGPRNWDAVMGAGTGIHSEDGFPRPKFKVSVNKTFEFVTLFGPALYQQNPVRTAKPRMPVIIPPAFFPDPNVYQSVIVSENQRIMTDGLRGVVLEAALNWSPNALGLAEQSRLSIDEALIKGRGAAWTELWKPPGMGFNVVKTSWGSTDDLLVDPDAQSFAAAKWIARRCIHPTWQVERDFGLPVGSLRGHSESQDKQSHVDSDADAEFERKKGKTNDLISYYKIYSKMGIGGRMEGANREMREALEVFGDYCYLCVAEGVPYPLNLSPDVSAAPDVNPADIYSRLAWPTPFWASNDGWPVSVLDFHAVHNSPWPLPHLKAGMGELRFLNWVMSFLMGRIKNTCRDFVAMRKSLDEDLKEAILNGPDLSILELEAEHGPISDLVQFLSHPEVNGDIWKIIEAVEVNFDKRVGLTELMYGAGGQTQIRSATEVQARGQNMNVRPDDMSKQVESWQSEIAAKEALCARWHLHANDIRPILGDLAANVWDVFVATRDIQSAAMQLEYRIESGSTQRPNKVTQVQQITSGFQAISPILVQYAQMTGDVGPLNNLLSDYAMSLELDPNRYQLAAMPPPPPPSGLAPVESGEEAGPAGAGVAGTPVSANGVHV